MLKLAEINDTRDALDMETLAELPDLDTHCDNCGEPLFDDDDFSSLDGGRCLVCQHSLVAVTEEQMAAWINQV